jgi:hypothetical protein
MQSTRSLQMEHHASVSHRRRWPSKLETSAETGNLPQKGVQSVRLMRDLG